jgi:hypothetical protein
VGLTTTNKSLVRCSAVFSHIIFLQRFQFFFVFAGENFVILFGIVERTFSAILKILFCGNLSFWHKSFKMSVSLSHLKFLSFEFRNETICFL